jgi:hypothetical protein
MAAMSSRAARLALRLLIFWLAVIPGLGLAFVLTSIMSSGLKETFSGSIWDYIAFTELHLLLLPAMGILWLGSWLLSLVLQKLPPIDALSRKRAIWFLSAGLISGFLWSLIGLFHKQPFWP